MGNNFNLNSLKNLSIDDIDDELTEDDNIHFAEKFKKIEKKTHRFKDDSAMNDAKSNHRKQTEKNEFFKD